MGRHEIEGGKRNEISSNQLALLECNSIVWSSMDQSYTAILYIHTCNKIYCIYLETGFMNLWKT